MVIFSRGGTENGLQKWFDPPYLATLKIESEESMQLQSSDDSLKQQVSQHTKNSETSLQEMKTILSQQLDSLRTSVDAEIKRQVTVDFSSISL